MENDRSGMSIPIILLIFIVALLGIIAYLLSNSEEGINSYQKCVDAGYPILETYPEQCKTSSGKTFTRSLTEDEQNRIEDPDNEDLQLGRVRVYFPKDPTSFDDPTMLVAVTRDVGLKDNLEYDSTVVIGQLIAGPTQKEQTDGLFTPLELTGDSNCEQSDFTVSASDTENSLTLQFCKSVSSAGVGSDARIQNAIEKTLMFNLGFEKVIILNRNGDCFGDQSGLNLCLK